MLHWIWYNSMKWKPIDQKIRCIVQLIFRQLFLINSQFIHNKMSLALLFLLIPYLLYPWNIIFCLPFCRLENKRQHAKRKFVTLYERYTTTEHQVRYVKLKFKAKKKLFRKQRVLVLRVRTYVYLYKNIKYKWKRSCYLYVLVY